MTIKRSAAARLACATIALAPALAAPLSAHATALDQFYERAVMSAADARCGLFTPSLGSALNAAKAQARGAALRSGVAAQSVADVEQRAIGKARVADCASKDITLAASRVRAAFDGYQRISTMTYPGEMAAWNAERSVSRQGPTWGLVQSAAFGWDKVNVGLVAGEGALVAVPIFADGARPYAARLVLRDTGRVDQPYLDRRQADAAGRMPLAARLPPASATRVFNAEQRTAAPEGLIPARTAKTAARAAIAFRFPRAAADALTGLDPREAVAVDFVIAGPNGETVRRAYLEVGDFAAGRAFVQMAAR